MEIVEIDTEKVVDVAEILNAETDSADPNMVEFENKCHEAWLAVQEGDYKNAIEYLDSAKEFVKKMQEESDCMGTMMRMEESER